MKSSDIIIKAAAVSDYKPKSRKKNKIKKSSDSISVEFIKTKDILKEIGMQKNDTLVVGFAAETENLEINSKRKLKNKKADFIVANDVSLNGAGFGSDTNTVTIIDSKGEVTKLPSMLKTDAGHKILDIAIN